MPSIFMCIEVRANGECSILREEWGKKKYSEGGIKD